MLERYAYSVRTSSFRPLFPDAIHPICVYVCEDKRGRNNAEKYKKVDLRRV